MASASIKMDELFVSWLSSDEVYERVLEWVENYRDVTAATTTTTTTTNNVDDVNSTLALVEVSSLPSTAASTATSTTGTSTTIPPFYPKPTPGEFPQRRRRRTPLKQHETWEPLVVTTTTTTTAASISTAVVPVLTPTSIDAPDDERSGTNTAMVVGGGTTTTSTTTATTCARDQARAIYTELGQQLIDNKEMDAVVAARRSHHHPNTTNLLNSNFDSMYLTPDAFVRITKEVCRFPSFFNVPLYQRILDLWNTTHHQNHNAADNASTATSKTDAKKGMLKPKNTTPATSKKKMDTVITFAMLEWYWKQEMEPYDAHDRFYRLVSQLPLVQAQAQVAGGTPIIDPNVDCIVRDDFLPFIKALLNDHPGLEFLSTHAEFQEKYAVTVITRIFYSVNKCHSGRITSRQIRRSDLLEAFQQVDEEEDINNVTRYFSYEHFYVLYCRFWELDHDRDYRITREDLLKYGDHSLSHMIVDRIFDAAPRPFHQPPVPPPSISSPHQHQHALALQQHNRDYLSYEDFIYFMLSEEDKSNEVSVRYWFTCVDVDGDGKLNNMEMRSFYAVQLHRMQCMGHEIVPFEDMLCQMMDMIKPANTEYLIPEDFLQAECCQVSGALFDALFNLNKYLLFEQRDPFVERQKREDEFECDWDRFACIDYKRLAMEEEAREEEAMEIDWVTVDDEDDDGQHDARRAQQQQQQRHQQHHQQQQQLQTGIEATYKGGNRSSSNSEAPF